jgi:hypothetical protein
MTAQGVNLQPHTGFPASQTVLQAIKPFPQYTGNLSPVGARAWEKLVRFAPDYVYKPAGV